MNCRAFGWILCTATRFAVFFVELISFSFNYLFRYILIKSTTSNSLKSRSRDFQKTESLQMKTRKMNQIFSTVKSVTVTVFSSSSTLKNRQKKFSPSSSKKQINFLFFVSLFYSRYLVYLIWCMFTLDSTLYRIEIREELVFAYVSCTHKQQYTTERWSEKQWLWQPQH